MRLIDGDEAVEKVQDIEPIFICKVSEIIATQRTADVIAMLENAPTIEAEPVKHGRWIHERLCSTTGGTYPVTRCSLCQNALPFEWTPQYCPNCGSQMDEGSENK